MPAVTYPPANPTVSGDLVTISRFLNNPTLVQRRLRTLAENRFISDTVLSGRANVTGGAVQYEQNESIFPDRPAESVQPGARFPSTTLGAGPTVIVGVKKWGIQTIVTDEAIRREQRSPVDRAMTKLVNGVVQQVDSVTLAAIAAAVTQSQTVPTAWATSTVILRDIMTAIATINALNQGYSPDTIVMDDATWAKVSTDPTLITARRREDPNNPVYSGDMGQIAGLDILRTPNLPTAAKVFILDRTQLGGLGDEVPLQSTTIREDDGPSVVEGWVLRAKRVVVPFVNEPASAIRLDGT